MDYPEEIQNLYVIVQDAEKALLEINPNGMSFRRKCCCYRCKCRTKGSNYVQHIDGYDKLKQFGFSIHSYINGYSRKVIWLEVDVTKVGDIIARYYLDAASIHG